MGLFSSIGSKFRDFGRKIGQKIEDYGWERDIEIFKNVGSKIQNACAEKIASEKSYDKKEANIYTTDRLNEILVSFSEGYLQQANSMENTCIRMVEEYYDELITEIESAPGDTNNKSNLKALKQGKNRISKSINGAIKDSLAKRMSIDDSECISILKMDSGNEKKQAMTKFTQKILKEALGGLSKSVRETLGNQIDDIKDYLNNISEEQEKEFTVLKEYCDKQIRDIDLEQSEKEQNCILPLFTIDASELVCEILK